MHLPEPPVAELARLIREAQSGERIPSISAAAIGNGEVVWQEALGLANVEEGVDADPNTQYRVGSITKTFTAAAVLQLRDAGATIELKWRWAGFPTVTATCKPMASPVASRFSGDAAAIDFCPMAPDGRSVSGLSFALFWAGRVYAEQNRLKDAAEMWRRVMLSPLSCRCCARTR